MYSIELRKIKITKILIQVFVDDKQYFAGNLGSSTIQYDKNCILKPIETLPSESINVEQNEHQRYKHLNNRKTIKIYFNDKQ